MKLMIKGASSGMKWPIILSSLKMFSSQLASIPSFWYPSSRSSFLLCKEAIDYWYPICVGLSLSRLYGMIADWL